MIKTFVYNELDIPSYNIDKEQVFKEIEDFVKNGGNLDYPVKSDNKLVSVVDFLESRIGVEGVTYLFDKKYLTSPGQWELNKEKNAIIESNLYSGYWYRDNAQKYRKNIADGFRKLCRQFSLNSVDSFHYQNYEKQIVKNEEENPLLSILVRVPLYELTQVFLEEVPNAKDLLNQIYYGKKPYYESLVKSSKDSENNLSLLFKHNVVDVDTLFEKYDFHEVIKTAIRENDFDFIHLLQSKSSNPNYLGELDKKYKMHDCFLRQVNTPEMAKILIDSGCPVLRKGDQYDSILFSHEYFSMYKLDTIDFIMNYVPLDYMGEYQNVFWQYLSNSRDLEQFKKITEFLVSKGFPLENYDLFNVCPGSDIQEKIKTCLDLGANPNNCGELIQRLVTNRDTSTFKAIQKTKLLNLYSPTASAYLLGASSHTQGTLNLLEKVEDKTFNSLTSSGKPVWFYANSKDKMTKIIKKIDSFNQLDSLGNNWLTHYYSLDIKDKHNIAPLLLEMASIEESKNKRLLVLSYVENQSNLLHHGFKFTEYKTNDFREEFVSMIKSFDSSNLNELLSGLDEHGLFPIDYLIKSKSEKCVWNKTFWDSKLDALLKIAEYNLDYDKTNSNGETLINRLREYYTIDNVTGNYIEPVEKGYSRYTLYNKLDNKLVPENRKSLKNKI